VLFRLLTDPAERERRGEAALRVARERAGGTEKTLALLKSYGVI